VRNVGEAPRSTLEELFRSRFDPMVRLAALLLGDHHVAEELVMDAFARVGDRLGQVDHPNAYLRTAVVNATRSHHRRRAVEDRLPLPAEPTADDHVVDELWLRLVDLRPDERAVVVLRFYEDLPLADIAEQLDLPLGTVKSHLHRGLASLRNLLGEEER
jgi:RNA polymerase sigma factor (sigma-70 family)